MKSNLFCFLIGTVCVGFFISISFDVENFKKRLNEVEASYNSPTAWKNCLLEMQTRQILSESDKRELQVEFDLVFNATERGWELGKSGATEKYALEEMCTNLARIQIDRQHKPIK